MVTVAIMATAMAAAVRERVRESTRPVADRVPA